MIIRCWGSRGSIPVSGKKYLRYGGNTTCLEIRTNDDKVLIVDAGSGIREAGISLMAEGHRDLTLLLTHAHWDHIMGFPFFKPIYSPRINLNVWGCPFAKTSIKEILSRIMAVPNFPIKFDYIRARISYQEDFFDSYKLGSLLITPIALSHPNRGTGYKFEEDGKCFVFLTDNELGFKHEGGLDFQDYLEFSKGADLLFHDAEYTEEEYQRTRSWGHSFYKDVLKLALDAGVRKLGLFHHNQERIDSEIDDIVSNCHKVIKKSGKKLECFAVGQSMEFKL
ncbi:MAG: MBL fold metallo-hydrolase [Deltaproteobacteria bacterium]|nr:MBL fold metallo-hydrolase [Deltaproteobacteria bacterium]